MFAIFEDGSHQYRVTDRRPARGRLPRGGQGRRFAAISTASWPPAPTPTGQIGRPLIDGAIDSGRSPRRDECKAPKLEIGKFRRRKGYIRHNGHTQKYTQVRITAINVPGAAHEAQRAARCRRALLESMRGQCSDAMNATSMPDHADLVNELRWKKFPVLNDGFVCLVDCMGDDGSVVQAARVSYGEGTKRVSDDRTLIRYLMRHRHTTPFEMAELKFLVRVPMDCWRQWIRHRTASVNEYSTRYSVAIDSSQTTLPHEWRTQAEQNRQGSGAPAARRPGTKADRRRAPFSGVRRGRCISSGWKPAWPANRPAKICPCRPIPKPTGKSTCTTCCTFWRCGWTRTPRQEIRDYSATIGEKIVKPLFPVVWEAFEDYRLGGLFLSRLKLP